MSRDIDYALLEVLRDIEKELKAERKPFQRRIDTLRERRLQEVFLNGDISEEEFKLKYKKQIAKIASEKEKYEEIRYNLHAITWRIKEVEDPYLPARVERFLSKVCLSWDILMCRISIARRKLFY